LNWRLAPAGTATYYMDGDTPLFDDRATGSTTVNIVGGNVNPWNVTFNNATKAYTLESTDGSGIAGPATLSVDDSGTVTITNSNSYSGGTAVNAGLLQLDNSGALGSVTAPLLVNGGTLDVHGYHLSVGPLSGLGTIDDLSGSGSLTVGDGDATSTFAGMIRNTTGELSLIKAGSGTLVLNGSDSYIGGTIVNAGKLIAMNANAIENGTNLTVGNSSAFAAPIVPVPAANIASPGPAALPAIAPVPEPGTLALLVGGAVVLAMYRKRR
jgi:autotransporter-associated beta strand protein